MTVLPIPALLHDISATMQPASVFAEETLPGTIANRTRFADIRLNG